MLNFREKKISYSKKGIFENRCLNAQTVDINRLTLQICLFKLEM
jgi:hypothetical protein